MSAPQSTDPRIAYAFFVQRPIDHEAWPVIFRGRQQAEEYPHRITEVAEVRLLDRSAADVPAEPKPCEHLRSELLAEKTKDGEPLFQMRKCLDCEKTFRVRTSVSAPADGKP